MKYAIEKKAGLPAYMQIYNQLRQDIASGLIPAGARLPSKRFLAGELGVSVITVAHAYELLVDGAYAQARQRSGYYADFGPGCGQASAPGRAKLADMSAELADMEDFPFSLLARTMRRVLSDYGRRILVKSPNSGCMELREALAAYLGRSRGLSVRPEQIVVGSGAEYLYSMAAQLLGRERVFALEEPCYDKIRRVYEANAVRCLPLRLGEDGILPEELAACSAGALHVTPFHSYPSGITASAARRHDYARWARERGAYIVEDDYDSDFASVSRRIETICSLAPERVIYINTFSKILAPSMRMGFMVLPEGLLGEYERRLGFYSCTVPVYDQYVLAEFINGGHMERYINRRRRKRRQEILNKTKDKTED
ncbi:MAG: PLP-dependent aminotransferase family protein [Clostridia bacterium]|nr:PLP-dependent aminotransferase family protein [Oscillospiraceae bacterium]PWM19862.1 MAG: PLP-dependent aminotransferase family protein [Clostridia bacterium]